jgi:hypothetical protein
MIVPDSNTTTWFASVMQGAFFNNPLVAAIAIFLFFAFILLMIRATEELALVIGLSVIYLLYLTFGSSGIFQSIFLLGLIAVGVLAVITVVKYARR